MSSSLLTSPASSPAPVRRGRPPNRFTWNAELRAIFDGLMLGAGKLVPRPVTPALALVQERAHAPWVETVAEAFREVGIRCRVAGVRNGDAISLTTAPYREFGELYGRWYETAAPPEAVVPGRDEGGSAYRPARVRRIDPELVVTPRTLATWFATVGLVYTDAVTLNVRTFPEADVRRVAALVAAYYGWLVSVYEYHGLGSGRPQGGWGLRLARLGDRLMFRDVVAPLVPACVWQRFNKPLPAPKRKTPKRAGCSRRLINGAFSKPTHWTEVAEAVAKTGDIDIRPKGVSVRFSDADLQDIANRLAEGETQEAVALRYGVRQSRISWLVRENRLPRAIERKR